MSAASDHPLLRFVRRLSVAHHIPGRIRLKLDGPLDAEVKAAATQAKQFGDSLSTMAGIRSVALNPLAKSCTIEYDISIIPSSAWSGLLNGEDTPDSASLLHSLITAARA